MADFAIDQVTEWKWEPGDVELAGCYELLVGWKLYATSPVQGQAPSLRPATAFFRGWRYVLGLQARTFDNHTRRASSTRARRSVERDQPGAC